MTGSPSPGPTPAPTDDPTPAPTPAPSPRPTRSPTDSPTRSPTDAPTPSPTYEACDEQIYSAPLDIIFVVDTICGLDVDQCQQQQDYISSLAQGVKNNINKIAYFECDINDPRKVIGLGNDRINDIPNNPPDYQELTKAFNDIKDSQTCANNAINQISADPDKLRCLDQAIREFDLNDFDRNKKVVYISNCEESTNILPQDSICSRDDLEDIGGRIDLIPVNVGTREFNIDVDELNCIVPDDKRIFDYDFIRDLNSNRQFQDIQREVCESPSARPTPGPTPDPTPSPTNDPTGSPTAGPTPYPSPAPSPAPTDDPTPAPTPSPSPAPTHSPGYEAQCVWIEPTDVVFVVDESCDIDENEIRHQNEFIANMVQRIKNGATDPRLGYIGCQPSIQTVLRLDQPLYNAPFNPIDAEDIRQMSFLFRDNDGYNPSGGRPPREECIKQAINQFNKGDSRNKKIVLISNCEESGQSDTCSLKDNEIANYGENIDFIFINVGTDDMNTCLDDSPDRLFEYDQFSQMNSRHGQAEGLTDEICQPPTPQPTKAPTS